MLTRRVAGAGVAAALVFGAPALALAGTAGSSPHTSSNGVSAVRHAAAGSTTEIIPLGGVTMLKIGASTASALKAHGVRVALASEARTSPSGIEFPIVGGVINATTLAGRINHAGGLTFVAGGKSLTIRDFIIDTTHARLTAWVDQVKARIPVLDLNLGKATIKATATRLSVKGVRATLDKTAAAALDGYFHTTLFTGGLPIGLARVSARSATVKA